MDGYNKMMSRRQAIRSILSAVTVLQTGVPVKASPEPALVMCIFPPRNLKITYALFSPLADYLSLGLNRDVKLVTARNFTEFWRGVRARQYDLVHFNQYHYVLSHHLYGYEVIAKNSEFGHDTISGAVTVRRDSGINSLMDLKGKTILFGGGPRAMMSYIAPTWLLRKAGLKPGDYNEKFALNPPNAMTSTYHRQADAAGTGDVVLQLTIVKNNIDTSEMKILAKTPALAHLPWAVNQSMPVSLRNKIQNFLTGMNNTRHGRSVLAKAHLTDIVASTDDDYNEIRTMVSEVYGDDFGQARLGK